MSLQNITIGAQNMLSQSMPRLACWLFSCRNLKNSKCWERPSLNSSRVSKHSSSKRNSLVINLFPRAFIRQRKLTPITGEKFRGQHHTETNLATNYHISHICSSKDPFNFPKNHPLFTKKPTYIIFPFPY